MLFVVCAQCYVNSGLSASRDTIRSSPTPPQRHVTQLGTCIPLPSLGFHRQGQVRYIPSSNDGGLLIILAAFNQFRVSACAVILPSLLSQTNLQVQHSRQAVACHNN